MTAVDWRGAAPADVEPVYAAEIVYWADALDWDTRATWRLVEAARASGVLPGCLARDAHGDVIGWSYFLLHGDTLEIGALVSTSESVTRRILEFILASPEAHEASSIILFSADRAVQLRSSLLARRFAVERYAYLTCPLTSAHGAAAAGRGWRGSDVRAIGDLLARAYPDAEPARPFARSGTTAEWREYVRQLVTTHGCGLLLPEHCVVVPAAGGEALDAVVLATRVGPRMAHLAQVVVDPAVQGHGLGRQIVATALHGLRGAGFEHASLLVRQNNDRAWRLYGSMGFEETASFVAGVLDQPRRFSSAALDTGGARTFR